jgi:hypothetical protein
VSATTRQVPLQKYRSADPPMLMLLECKHGKYSRQLPLVFPDCCHQISAVSSPSCTMNL